MRDVNRWLLKRSSVPSLPGQGDNAIVESYENRTKSYVVVNNGEEVCSFVSDSLADLGAISQDQVQCESRRRGTCSLRANGDSESDAVKLNQLNARFCLIIAKLSSRDNRESFYARSLLHASACRPQAVC